MQIAFTPYAPPRLPSPPNRATLFASSYPRLTQHRHTRPRPASRASLRRTLRGGGTGGLGLLRGEPDMEKRATDVATRAGRE